MDARSRREILDAIGVTAWVPRERVEAAEDAAPAVVEPVAGASAPMATADGRIGAEDSPTIKSGMGWAELRDTVRGCEKCGLRAGCTQTVFGVGNETAEWMFIGEAPGADEDRQGEPFVGRAGQLLNSMIAALRMKREQVFIANILKCRPPNNRDPRPEEVAQCLPYLQRQVELVRPKLIVCVGRIAAQNLLATETPIGKLRGRVHDYRGTPVVVTYHPAYLLRSPGEKRKAWDDLKLAKRVATGAA